MTATLARLLPIAALAWMTAGCGPAGCAAPKGDVRRVVPADARVVVVIGSLKETQEQLAAFLAGIEGASGLIELFDARYGVDLGSPNGLAQAGFDDGRGAVAFVHQGYVGVGVGVRDPERFDRLMSQRARLLGSEVEQREQGVRLARPGPDGHRPLAMAWRVTADAIGLVGVGTDADEVVVRVLAMTSAAGEFFRTPQGQPTWTEREPPIWAWARWTPTLPTDRLPFMMRDTVKKNLASFGSWVLEVWLDGSKLSAVARGEGAGLPAEWFKLSGPSAGFDRVLPRHSTVAARIKTAIPELVQAVPSFVLKRVLPERLPSIDNVPLPTPKELLEIFNGELSLAILGLDDDALLTQLAPRRQLPEKFFQMAHMAVGVGVKDVSAVETVLTRLAVQARERGFAVAALGEPGRGINGYSFVTRRPLKTRSRRPDTAPRTYALLVSKTHRALFFVTGRGEVARFLDVAAGKALALRGLAEVSAGDAPTTPTVRAAISGEGVQLSAVATPTRIARELADKGVPPYFLKMMSDLFAVALTLDVSPEQVRMKVDVQL